MKAVEMHKFGSKEVFEERDVPKPSPGNGEVCIQIKASGFNPVDYKLRGGWFPIDPNQILGCDCSGVIESVGEGTPSFSIGDEVYSICGSFFHCSNGGYAEYVCVPAELVAKKPANLTFEEAAAVPLAAMTAYRATLAVSAIKAGDAVFVAGLGGGVGTFAAQFLRVAGVKNVYTVAKGEKSAAFLQKELGMRRDHILIYDGLSSEELKEKLIEMNSGKLFDATLDLVGGKVKELCLDLTGYSGHFSTILPESDFQWFDVWSENSIPRGRNLSIHQVAIGAELGSQDRKTWQIYRRHMGLISQMIESGQVRPIVQNIGPLSAKTVQKAHELLEEGHVKGKLIMKVG
jgi:NADPH:quinone reductase